MSRTYRRKNISAPRWLDRQIRDLEGMPHEHEAYLYYVWKDRSHPSTAEYILAKVHSDFGYNIHNRDIYGDGKRFMNREARRVNNTRLRLAVLHDTLDEVMFDPDHKVGEVWDWD